jgi:uncharacterized membrane protein
MKGNKQRLLLSSVLILIPIPVGLYLWKQLPEQMATHWGFDGTPNGYSSKAFAVFGMPLFVLLIHLLCIFFTGKDPKNRGRNEKMKALVYWICPVISLFVSMIIYRAAFGKVEVLVPIMLLFGVLFLAIGNLMPKTRRNSTIGVRLPWTLGDDEVWNKTHRLTGKVWVTGSIIILLDAFLGIARAYVLTAALAAMFLIPVVYSYLIYQQKTK